MAATVCNNSCSRSHGRLQCTVADLVNAWSRTVKAAVMVQCGHWQKCDTVLPAKPTYHADGIPSNPCFIIGSFHHECCAAAGRVKCMLAVLVQRGCTADSTRVSRINSDSTVSAGVCWWHAALECCGARYALQAQCVTAVGPVLRQLLPQHLAFVAMHHGGLTSCEQ